jgi:hypothetical protein
MRGVISAQIRIATGAYIRFVTAGYRAFEGNYDTSESKQAKLPRHVRDGYS